MKKENELQQLQEETKSEDLNLTNTESNKDTNTPLENKTSKENVKSEDENSIKDKISELNLKIIVNKENSERLKSAYLISSDLQTIGINSTINELSKEEMNTAIANKDYDIALVGWELSSVPDAISIIQSSGYTDEKLTNYVTSLLDATTPSQISDIYNAIQKYVNQNVLFMSLVIREDYIVSNRRLEGNIFPNDFDVYEGISNLNIEYKK